MSAGWKYLRVAPSLIATERTIVQARVVITILTDLITVLLLIQSAVRSSVKATVALIS